MFVSSPEETRVLKRLGRELLCNRIARKQRQADFAARLGISIPTYRRMERGSGRVPLAYWIRALAVLDYLKGFETALSFGEPAAAAESPPAQRKPGSHPTRG